MVSSLAEEAVCDESFYKQLIKEVETGSTTHAMKASWILGTGSSIDLELATKYASKILLLALCARVGGVQRELLKTLNDVNLHEKEQGVLLDFCFKKLVDANSDLAVKYYSAAQIEKSLKKYPELQNEYMSVLEGTLEMHTEAWKRYTSKRLLRLKNAGIRRKK